MSAESAAAYGAAVRDFRAARGEDSRLALLAAARQHLDSSRPLADVKAEYDALQAAEAAGEPADRESYAELAAELSAARKAAENLAGNLPGSGHAASAGIGA